MNLNDLSFLPGIMKFEKVNKLVTILYDKIEDVIHIRNLKQGLNHGLVLRKVHKVITFNIYIIYIPYIYMNTSKK